MLQKLQQKPEYAAAKLLQTVPAVGIVTAMTYLLTIGDPARFSNSRDVAAFLGLAPARKQSGASDACYRIAAPAAPYAPGPGS